MRTKRIDEIELYIREKKSVSLDTLCEVFNVSKNTIRRDIATLEQSGKIKKVYGGVTIADFPASKMLLPFSTRHQSLMQEKRLTVNWLHLMCVIMIRSLLTVVQHVIILLIL